MLIKRHDLDALSTEEEPQYGTVTSLKVARNSQKGSNFINLLRGRFLITKTKLNLPT